MKAVVILLISIVSMSTADFYSSKYDDFDVEPLLENDRILQGYTNCFLDQGPCTPDAKDFKKVIPEAIETNCGKCSAKQTELIKKVVHTLRERHPEAWDQITKKYDQDNKYTDTFHKFIAEK